MLNTKEYTEKVEVDSKNVRKFFDKNKQDFFEPQKVKVDFIELSNTIVAQLKQGESFSRLAAKYSKDAGSKDSGGSLGFLL